MLHIDIHPVSSLERVIYGGEGCVDVHSRDYPLRFSNNTCIISGDSYDRIAAVIDHPPPFFHTTISENNPSKKLNVFDNRPRPDPTPLEKVTSQRSRAEINSSSPLRVGIQ